MILTKIETQIFYKFVIFHFLNLLSDFKYFLNVFLYHVKVKIIHHYNYVLCSSEHISIDIGKVISSGFNRWYTYFLSVNCSLRVITSLRVNYYRFYKFLIGLGHLSTV